MKSDRRKNGDREICILPLSHQTGSLIAVTGIVQRFQCNGNSPKYKWMEGGDILLDLHA